MRLNPEINIAPRYLYSFLHEREHLDYKCVLRTCRWSDLQSSDIILFCRCYVNRVASIKFFIFTLFIFDVR